MFKQNLEAMEGIINRDGSSWMHDCIERVLVAYNCWNTDHICFLVDVFCFVDLVKCCVSAHFDFMSTKVIENEQKQRYRPFVMTPHDGSFGGVTTET